MDKRGWVLAILLVLCCLGSVRAGAIEPHWLSDWEEGRKAARASGKPLFVVFRCEH
jgi:hypothetical protein